MQQKYEDLGKSKMLGRFFKNNDRLGFILLPVIAVAIWIFSFILPSSGTINFQNSYLLGLLEGELPLWLWKFFNLLCAVGGAYLITFMCIRQEITDRQNQIPGLIYLIFCGTLNLDGAFHPLLLGNILLLSSFILLFGIYRQDLSLSAIFDASFFASLAVFVYTPLVAFTLAPFLALLILKAFKLREWLLSLLAIIFPILLTSCILFLLNQPQDHLLQMLKTSLVSFHLPVFTKGWFLIHSVAALLLILGIYNSIFNSGNFKIKGKKNKNILLWALVLGGISVFFTNDSSFFKAALIIIPFSVFLGDYLGNIKSGGLREFLTVLLLAAYVFSNLIAANYV